MRFGNFIIRVINSNYPQYTSPSGTPQQPLESSHLSNLLKIRQGSDQLPPSSAFWGGGRGEEGAVFLRVCQKSLETPYTCFSERTFPVTCSVARVQGGLAGAAGVLLGSFTVSETQCFQFVQGRSDTKQLIWNQSISFQLGIDLSRHQNRENGGPTSACRPTAAYVPPLPTSPAAHQT